MAGLTIKINRKKGTEDKERSASDTQKPIPMMKFTMEGSGYAMELGKDWEFEFKKK